ncbi:MAG TPA: zinc-dependent metalloprotease, partial [Candidatus Binatia bacterium]|nr:zinc-dependent metalloprotease [Candidatus Binatia bacterium]
TILEDGHKKDLWYLSNQDTSAHPRVDQWSNGTDAPAELKRMMAIRKAALSRFGEQAIKRNEPMATIEEVLVPLYLHHRYQVEATASTVGGIYYGYALRGDGRDPVKFAPAPEQRAALEALLATLKPSELALPRELLAKIPPRPSGYGVTRELFPRYTGQMFDAITPSVVAADMVVGQLLDDARGARLVEQHALDPTLPGLDAVIDQLLSSTFGATSANAYEAEIARAVQRVVVERLMTLASTADMPRVRAIASQKLQQRAQRLSATPLTSAGASAHAALLASDIKRFLDRPFAPATRTEIPAAPPGAPIGDPGMDWLGRLSAYCGWEER